ncbi:dihydropteroate synthase [Risungbinella massiliensis]|uniref:dihydropteroate synthase n=1 Tax=Risungbinella massiliensis TaxID=1329796 RepID=UPI0005CC56BD|nr:dihydropteroate synthase [Risungbinella massiliensis]
MNRILQLGSYRFPSHKTLVMGIVNVTPDSFSDGGRYNTIEQAVLHAQKLVAEGADILDIGGESTRPGATMVSLEKELDRVVPVIEAISREVDAPISIDTYKAKVGEEAIKAGAHLLNDIWGGKKDPDMVRVAAKTGVPIVLMQNREKAEYRNLIADMQTDLLESISIAKSAGVTDEQIILDPGIGFAKSYEDNLLVMRKLEAFTTMGYPVLLGTSRKSLIARTLELPTDERVEGTAATVALGITKGCQIVRVHDVKEIARVCKMMDAMLYRKHPSGE